MEAFENLPPIVVLLLGFVLVAWLVLVFLVPFMIEGIRQSVRKTHDELVATNEKLDQLNALMAHAVGRSAAAPRRAEPAPPRAPEPRAPRETREPPHGGEVREPRENRPPPRGRREPTISEPTVGSGGSRNRREPTVR